MSDLTASDIAAIRDSNSNGIFGGNGVTLIVLILFFLTLGNGGLFGGGNVANQEALTRAELYEGLNSQNTFNEFRSIQNDITNGFANNALAMNCGFNGVNANINALASQMATSCCDLKTAIHSEGEATRALIQQNTIDSLASQLQDAKNTNLVTGLTTAQVIQTNNLESYMRQLINGGCCCGC